MVANLCPLISTEVGVGEVSLMWLKRLNTRCLTASSLGLREDFLHPVYSSSRWLGVGIASREDEGCLILQQLYASSGC